MMDNPTQPSAGNAEPAVVKFRYKKRGRPPRKTYRRGERVPLGLRVTPACKTALLRAANISGRSQSQEAEYRIEQSFRDDRLLNSITAEVRVAIAKATAGRLTEQAPAQKAAAT